MKGELADREHGMEAEDEDRTGTRRQRGRRMLDDRGRVKGVSSVQEHRDGKHRCTRWGEGHFSMSGEDRSQISE